LAKDHGLDLKHFVCPNIPPEPTPLRAAGIGTLTKNISTYLKTSEIGVKALLSFLKGDLLLNL